MNTATLIDLVSDLLIPITNVDSIPEIKSSDSTDFLTAHLTISTNNVFTMSFRPHQLQLIQCVHFTAHYNLKENCTQTPTVLSLFRSGLSMFSLLCICFLFFCQSSQQIRIHRQLNAHVLSSVSRR